jgi:TP901 family phage tail tape measure protein|tara:strand:+ start:4573 stop:8580 length:4008 start_codon:yes stop_codon:yes gene_type:complete
VATTGAAMVMFEVVGSFQAKRLLSDARAQMNIMNAIMLNGLSGIFQAVDQITEQIDGMVDATVPLAQEFAQARIQFDKFMGEAENLEEVREDIKKIGLEFGFTADKALEAGAKMAQLKDVVGGEGSVVAATEVGIKFALIGDMETQDAMQKLVNLQQQTDFMFGDLTQSQIEAMNAEQRANLVRANSMKVLTQLNTVENRSAATMQQITFIMNQFASQANLTGESIADMAANAAVLVESGEEMGKAGRALRMIYARLGANTKDNNDVLAQFGVSVKDTAGNLRPLSDITADLAEKFPDLTEAEQQHIAQLVAGNDHYVRFIKLVQGSERQQILATQASLGLSDAQEEVNIKIQDQANQLKKLQSELKNTQAEMGSAFIPAQMKATQAQISFNKAITDLYTTGTDPMGELGKDLKAISDLDFSNFNIIDTAMGSIVKGGIDFAFAFQRVQKVLGPVVEAMINIKSLSVAIQTQQTIMRAMQGEQLVNANIYNQAAQSQALTTELAFQELHARERIGQAGALALQIANGEKSTHDQKLISMHAQNSAATTLNDLAKQRHNLAAQIGNLEQNMLNVVQQADAAQKNINATIRARAAASATLSAQELQVLGQKVSLLTNEAMQSQIKIETMKNEHAMALATVQAGNVKVRNAYKEKELLEELIQLGFIEKETVTALQQDKRRSLEIDRQQLQIARNNIALRALEAELADELGIQQLGNMIQRLVQSQLANQELGKSITLTEQMNSLGEQERLIINSVTSGKFIKNELTDAEVTALQVLLPLLKQQNITSEAQAQNLYEIILAQVQYNATQDVLMQKQMATNASMTKYSALLGGASGLITLFDDSTKGAKASMALMVPVMIMSTIQMIQMTNSMVNQATQAVKGSVANTGYAFSFKAVGAAASQAATAVKGFMASTGVGLIAIAAITAAVYMFSDGSEEAAASIIVMNNAMTDSLSIIQDLQSTGLDETLSDIPIAVQSALEAAGISDFANIAQMNMAELENVIAITADEIKRLTELAGDGETVQERLFQTQLDAANKYIGALKTQETLLISQLALSGDLSSLNEKNLRMSGDNAASVLQQLENEFGDDFGDINARGFFGYSRGDLEDDVGKSAHDAAGALIFAFEQELGKEMSRANIEDLLEVLTHTGLDHMTGLSAYEEHIRDSGKYTGQFMEFLEGLRDVSEETSIGLDILSLSMNDLGDFETEDLSDYTDVVEKLRNNFNMTEDSAQTLVDIIGEMGSDSGPIDETAESIEHLGQTMAEFNNNREAMFFGLSQSGATGDFVKQVQQKGVENLVANTELIITNNFNGMLLHEMVTEVTEGVIENLVNAGVVQAGAVG